MIATAGIEPLDEPVDTGLIEAFAALAKTPMGEWSPAITAVAPAVATSVTSLRDVPIANLPLVPHKREWLHGNDLMRGAVSMLV